MNKERKGFILKYLLTFAFVFILMGMVFAGSYASNSKSNSGLSAYGFISFASMKITGLASGGGSPSALACDNDLECAEYDAKYPYCENGACVECKTGDTCPCGANGADGNAQCAKDYPASGGDNGYTQCVSGGCAECTTDNNCGYIDLPVCGSSNSCIECKDNNDCETWNSNGDYVCSSNSCVECTESDTSSCGSDTPYCASNTCVQCTDDSQCQDGETCSSNSCVPADCSDDSYYWDNYCECEPSDTDYCGDCSDGVYSSNHKCECDPNAATDPECMKCDPNIPCDCDPAAPDCIGEL